MGSMVPVHLGTMDEASGDLKILIDVPDAVLKPKNAFKATQVAVQIKTVEAWMFFQSGKKDEGLKTMILAANMEDSTQKHPVAPGEVLPARELLCDMLLEMNQPQ